MGRVIVTTFAFIFAVIAVFLSLLAIIEPQWMRDDASNRVASGTNYNSVGLWIKCIWSGDTKNTRQCQPYNEIILELPIQLLGSRVLSILAVLLGVTSIVTGIISSDCILFWKKPIYRMYMHYLASITSILAGICIGSAVGWYAKLVINQLGGDKNTRQVFGASLYYGLFSFILHVISGICFVFGKSQTWEEYKKFNKLQKTNPTMMGKNNLAQAIGEYIAPNARPNLPIVIPDLQSGRNKVPLETTIDVDSVDLIKEGQIEYI